MVVEGVLCCEGRKMFLICVRNVSVHKIDINILTTFVNNFFVFGFITNLKEALKYLEMKGTLSSPLHMYYEFL